MDDMDKLIAWLRVQVAEDESSAQAAFSGQADPENGWGESRTPGYAGVTITPHVGHVHEDVQAAHVVRWNPARALREVEAKRRLLHDFGGFFGLDDFSRGLVEHSFKLMALSFSDRPGYQESWRP